MKLHSNLLRLFFFAPKRRGEQVSLRNPVTGSTAAAIPRRVPTTCKRDGCPRRGAPDQWCIERILGSNPRKSVLAARCVLVSRFKPSLLLLLPRNDARDYCVAKAPLRQTPPFGSRARALCLASGSAIYAHRATAADRQPRPRLIVQSKKAVNRFRNFAYQQLTSSAEASDESAAMSTLDVQRGQ